MEPFVKAISEAVGLIVMFGASIIGGMIVAALTTRDGSGRQAVTGLVALVIFLIIFLSTHDQ